jgi:uncharacterized repeat protein (TIGR01451 family)
VRHTNVATARSSLAVDRGPDSGLRAATSALLPGHADHRGVLCSSVRAHLPDTMIEQGVFSEGWQQFPIHGLDLRDIGSYEYGDVATQSLVANGTKVPAGSKVTYTATVVNAGAVGATRVVAKDTLPVGEKFKSAKSSVGTCTKSGSAVTCALGALSAAKTATITIVATVTAKKGSKLNDSMTVSATTGDTIPGNDSKAKTITVS